MVGDGKREKQKHTIQHRGCGVLCVRESGFRFTMAPARDVLKKARWLNALSTRQDAKCI